MPLRVPYSVFAVIMPAEKLPPESLATMELPVFVLVAFTVHVTAFNPLKAIPLRYVPGYRLQATWVAVPLRVPYSVVAVRDCVIIAFPVT